MANETKASSLDEFLELDDITDVRKTVTITAANGKSLKIVIRPMTRSEHSSFQKRSMVIDVNGGKTSYDIGKYAMLASEACIVEPNFKDSSFLAKANCQSAGDFIQKKFAAGTLMEISEAIQNLSGFKSLTEDVEEAKN